MTLRLKQHKNLTQADKRHASKVLKFIASHPNLEKEICCLSALKNEKEDDVKFTYDKLLLLKKDDWKKIIDLGSQTKIFNNLEVANIKATQLALARRQPIKELSLLKCIESIRKLSKFGIKI